MLNLLIISDNPKAKLIQKFIQPQIKTKIDVVADFDHGLKDVFEKRPATVIIQEQIAGVAGESVARHIQLLLGTGAPAFIMMHEGNARIRPIKGLFEVIVDLDQNDETLVEEVLSVLKRLIGAEWDKVAIAPPELEMSRVVTAHVPEEDRDAADKLVEDFFSDLDTSEKQSPGHHAVLQSDASEDHAVSSTDEMATLLINAAQDAENHEFDVNSVPQGSAVVKKTRSSKRPVKEKTAKTVDMNPAVESAPEAESAGTPATSAIVSSTEKFEIPELDNASPLVLDRPQRTVPLPVSSEIVAGTAQQNPAVTAPSPSAADFRIISAPPVQKEPLPEDILSAFDENYRSRSSMWGTVLTVVVVACVATGGWYLYKTKPQLLGSWWASNKAVPVTQPNGVPPVAVAQPATTQAIQKTMTAAAKPASASISSLPSFVPVSGRDSEYSNHKPGWERYVDAAHEVRIFRSAGRIKALQVIASKGQAITEPIMRAALKEVTGSTEYTLRSREQKQGIVIQRCSIGAKSDLLVYRKQSTDGISAFVISLE